MICSTCSLGTPGPKYVPVSGLCWGLGIGSVSLTLPNGLLQPLGSLPLQNQADGMASGVKLDFIPSSDLGRGPHPGAYTSEDPTLAFLLLHYSPEKSAWLKSSAHP